MDGQQTTGAVDFSVLHSYSAGDEGFVREVLTLFRSEALEWAPRLVPEASDWRATVHTIKGTSRTIGARTLGDLCERAEREGLGLLPSVRGSLEAVLAEIDGYLGEGV
ncbi:MAG TPA: Hpt domain-containing protein [Caulobacteraceae bacterium]|nr:Hpt domain-containing protein [Caulobacteraceae bacterium]